MVKFDHRSTPFGQKELTMAFEHLLNPRTIRLIDWFVVHRVSRYPRAIAAGRISDWVDLRQEAALTLLKNPPESGVRTSTAICNAVRWMVGHKCERMHKYNRLKEFSHERITRSYVDRSADIGEWERQHSIRELVERALSSFGTLRT